MSTIQVINYLKNLQNAYLIHKVKRIDIAGLRTFEIGDKYFFEDLGLRQCNSGFSMQQDINKLSDDVFCRHVFQ